MTAMVRPIPDLPACFYPAKPKLILALIGYTAIFALGVWTWHEPPVHIKLAGALSVITAVIFFFLDCKKLFSGTPDLVIKTDGVQLSGLPNVTWDDISALERKGRLVIVFLKNPNGYIQQFSSKLDRFIAWFARGFRDTQILIHSRRFNINADELIKWLDYYKSKYGSVK